MKFKIVFSCVAASLFGGCAVAKTTGKVITAPVKVAAKTGELASKGVYNTGKYATKGVYHTSKGAYTVAAVPVQVVNGALDTTAKILTVTTQAVDLSGKVITTTRTIQRSELDAYINQSKATGNVIGIVIDVFK